MGAPCLVSDEGGKVWLLGGVILGELVDLGASKLAVLLWKECEGALTTLRK